RGKQGSSRPALPSGRQPATAAGQHCGCDRDYRKTLTGEDSLPIHELTALLGRSTETRTLTFVRVQGMFAALAIERDPLRLQDLPAGLESWVQSAGGYALVGVVLWLIFAFPMQKPADRARTPSWQTMLFAIATLASFAFYLVFLALRWPELVKQF